MQNVGAKRDEDETRRTYAGNKCNDDDDEQHWSHTCTLCHLISQASIAKVHSAHSIYLLLLLCESGLFEWKQKSNHLCVLRARKSLNFHCAFAVIPTEHTLLNLVAGVCVLFEMIIGMCNIVRAFFALFRSFVQHHFASFCFTFSLRFWWLSPYASAVLFLFSRLIGLFIFTLLTPTYDFKHKKTNQHTFALVSSIIERILEN